MGREVPAWVRERQRERQRERERERERLRAEYEMRLVGEYWRPGPEYPVLQDCVRSSFWLAVHRLRTGSWTAVGIELAAVTTAMSPVISDSRSSAAVSRATDAMGARIVLATAKGSTLGA